MFLSVVAAALIVGALAGGGLPRLADLRLRWIGVLFLALGLRVGAVLLRQNEIGTDLPLGWLWVAAYLLIFVWLFGNWRVPGLQVASVGIGLNALAVVLNNGQMPIWAGAFEAAGFTSAALADNPFHFVMATSSVADFVARGGIFGDVVPIPIPVIRDVLSIGDVLLAIGIFWAIVYTMTRPDAPVRGAIHLGPRPADPFAGIRSIRAHSDSVQASVMTQMTSEEASHEVRPQSPYLSLVRNRNFSLLWVGQLLSFFGDRVHQVAMGVLLLQVGTPLDVGIAFGATALPNVFLGPLAGVFVDRWDRRTTMIACDIVRAGLVLLVPLVVNVHIGLVYLIAFLVATVGLLFRPAKTAILPRIVKDDHLVTANSASSVAETMADLGYPVAAALVTALAGLIAAAFVLDAATYVVSALLIWAMVVPRDLSAPEERATARVVWREMAEGLRFLVQQRELLANTLISTVALLAFGAEIVVSLVYAERVLDQSVLEFPTNYGWLQGSLGLGSVFGGVLLGAVATRAPKGLLTIAGFVGLGVGLIAAGLVTDPYLAIAIFFAMGVANMLYLVPTITLFQQRTPERLFGRVVSTRQALTFGAMALSMGVSGWLAGIIGPESVLIGGGVLLTAAGLAGLTLPAMRNAR